MVQMIINYSSLYCIQCMTSTDASQAKDAHLLISSIEFKIKKYRCL